MSVRKGQSISSKCMIQTTNETRNGQFGLGSRTCIGRNISLMEISKALPQLLRQFTFVPEGGVPQWSKAENVWFVKHKNLRYTVRLR